MWRDSGNPCGFSGAAAQDAAGMGIIAQGREENRDRLRARRMDGIWNLPEGDLHAVSLDIDRVDFE
jgi:hypothetical protein